MLKHTSIDALRTAGLRVTPARERLMALLMREAAPLSAADIHKKLKGSDAVTVYRTLETLADAGILTRTDFHHGHAEYELAAGRPHHHHLVCDACGVVEDFKCPAADIEKHALRRSKRFTRVESHSLEIFGRCATCT